MNLMSHISTRKNSVNSSLATVKDSNQTRQVNQTINRNRQKCKVRFSYQQGFANTGMLQKSNSFKENMLSQKHYAQQFYCFNHKDMKATHSVLGDSSNPMYCCKRCAILIVSKGFDIEPLSCQADKQNILNRRNTHKNEDILSDDLIQSRNGYKIYPNKQSKVSGNTLHQFNIKNTKKINLNTKTVSQLQIYWQGLKSGRKQSLSQIDICINSLNQNLDKLQDFFYTLHEYVQKQKNQQIKQILSKKQLLETLRFQTNNFFIKQFTSVRSLKQKLIKCGQCQLETYNKVIDKYKIDSIIIDSETILQKFSVNQTKRENIVHEIGNQITEIIKRSSQLKKRESTYIQRDRSVFLQNQHIPFTRTNNNYTSNNNGMYCNPRDDSSFKKLKILQLVQSNEFEQNEEQIQLKQSEQLIQNKIVPQVNNIESSVRSLQLSFQNSQNSSETGEINNNQSQVQSSNFTLNRYIKQKGQQSYTNLLMTSTEF